MKVAPTVCEKELPHSNSYNGEPPIVRLTTNRIRAHVKHDLPITFSDGRISAHGELELLRRYLVAIDLPGRLRQALGDGGGRSTGASGARASRARTKQLRMFNEAEAALDTEVKMRQEEEAPPGIEVAPHTRRPHGRSFRP
jgi:hypothetical protein